MLADLTETFVLALISSMSSKEKFESVANGIAQSMGNIPCKGNQLELLIEAKGCTSRLSPSASELSATHGETHLGSVVDALMGALLHPLIKAVYRYRN